MFKADLIDSYYYGYPHVKKLLNSIRKPRQLKKFLASLGIDPKEVSILEINLLVANANNPRVLKLYLDNVSGNSNNDLNFVDLGLPSGTLWAKINIGATNENEAGLYYSWANIEGHTPGDEYSFILNNYEMTVGYSANKINNVIYDVALLETSGQLRIPSKEEFEELIDNCTVVFIEAVGWTFTSNINGKTLFFPVTGYMNATNLSYHDFDGCYWANEEYPEENEPNTKAYCMYLNIAADPHTTREAKRFGFCIRGVKAAAVLDYVDLGLPSGTLWARKNIGAQSEIDYGLYFAWGETTGYAEFTEEKLFTYEDYKFDGGPSSGNSRLMTKYNDDNNNILLPEDDAATVIMGSLWSIPSSTQLSELDPNYGYVEINHVHYSDGLTNHILGIVYTSKINGNSLYIPAGGINFGHDSVAIWGNKARGGSYNTSDSFYNEEVLGSTRWQGLNVKAVTTDTNKYNIVLDYQGEYESVNALLPAEWLPNAQLNTVYGYALYGEDWYPVVVSRIEEDNGGSTLIYVGLEGVDSEGPYEFAVIQSSVQVNPTTGPIGSNPNPIINPNPTGISFTYSLTITLENSGGYVANLILYNKPVNN